MCNNLGELQWASVRCMQWHRAWQDVEHWDDLRDNDELSTDTRSSCRWDRLWVDSCRDRMTDWTLPPWLLCSVMEWTVACIDWLNNWENTQSNDHPISQSIYRPEQMRLRCIYETPHPLPAFPVGPFVFSPMSLPLLLFLPSFHRRFSFLQSSLCCCCCYVSRQGHLTTTHSPGVDECVH